MTLSGADAHAQQSQFNISAPALREKPQQSRQQLSADEEKQLEQLKRRDAEVRQHEHAHKAAAGQFVSGGPSYDYETGPDGKQYAVGGEVQIDTSEVPNDPQATMKKAQQIKRAALAPKDPSSQDRKIAAEASKMEAKARQELGELKREEKQLYNQNGQKAGHLPQAAVFDLFV